MATTASTTKPTARERLLAAADELFYSEGVQTVGVDRVVQLAGVAKASLYNLFGSKDELVQAYLDARHANTRGSERANRGRRPGSHAAVTAATEFRFPGACRGVMRRDPVRASRYGDALDSTSG